MLGNHMSYWRNH